MYCNVRKVSKNMCACYFHISVYHFKVEVLWVRKVISYQSNKAYSVTTASLFILQIVRTEFDSLFRALSLHCFFFVLAHLEIQVLHAISVYNHYSHYMIPWYWHPLSLVIYTFWALITRVPKPVNTIPTAPPLISSRITHMCNSWAVKGAPVAKEHCLGLTSNACSPCATRCTQEAMLAAKALFWYIWYLL